MQRLKAMAFILTAGLLLAEIAGAGDHGVSVEKGKKLFNDPKLGSTGKSCNDCHPDGRGIEDASGRKNLDLIVNGCITQNLGGKALDVNSPDMQSLILYIKSLNGRKKQESKTPVGC